MQFLHAVTAETFVTDGGTRFGAGLTGTWVNSGTPGVIWPNEARADGSRRRLAGLAEGARLMAAWAEADTPLFRVRCVFPECGADYGVDGSNLCLWGAEA